MSYQGLVVLPAFRVVIIGRDFHLFPYHPVGYVRVQRLEQLPFYRPRLIRESLDLVDLQDTPGLVEQREIHDMITDVDAVHRERIGPLSAVVVESPIRVAQLRGQEITMVSLRATRVVMAFLRDRTPAGSVSVFGPFHARPFALMRIVVMPLFLLWK